MTILCCVIFKAPLSTYSASRSEGTKSKAYLLAIILPDWVFSGHKWDWLTENLTACISCGDLHISCHNTHTFQFNHMTASTYFHRCILCKESLIDCSVKGQYAPQQGIFASPVCTLISLSVEVIFLQRYMNWSTNFRGLPFNEAMASAWLKCMNLVLSVFFLRPIHLTAWAAKSKRSSA